MRLAILDDYQNVALTMADWEGLRPSVQIQIFRDTLKNEDAVAERLREFEIIVAMRERTAFRRSLLERLPKLKLLVTTGMVNASIDKKAAAEQGIIVSGTTSLRHPTAELTWGLMLALARNITREDAAMRKGAWQTTVGVSLHGKVLGILGLGKLGGQVAAFGKAFMMDVIAWSENLTLGHADSLGVRRVEKQELFRRADFLTIHTVLSKRTRGIVGPDELAAMKSTSYLINTSRGPIVEERALIAALETRKIAGAALDVYDQEPLPADHALRRLENVILTPHLGYVTDENYRAFYGEAAENVRAYLAGNPIRVLNPA
ncbi:MAG: D-isomer specific 2-hydroxyacid dehydrogenase NAD-binding protein [Candidatus Acidoferrum typicum]|nr:D-isomer specific 2-hydroxyacid dehydrogenase NAD-binding protein [Candidatus Acidoferrum typicum]